MSTRAVIARKTKSGFTGVYHHWDGYPSGLGATLFEVRKTIFNGNTDRFLKYLIDMHPGGWSTINKDWSKPESLRPDDQLEVCEECGKPSWMHYRQYYQEGHSPKPSYWELAGRPPIPTEYGPHIMVLGHPCKSAEVETGPEPSGGDSGQVDDTNASGCGCEWAYVFDGNGKMEVQASICGPGKFEGAKMIGAFGCGDEKATWKTVAVVNLDAEEPDWEKIAA